MDSLEITHQYGRPGRRTSYFPARNISIQGDDNEDPVIQKLHYFYQELAQLCQLRSTIGIRSSYQCFAAEEASISEDRKIENFIRLKKLS